MQSKMIDFAFKYVPLGVIMIKISNNNLADNFVKCYNLNWSGNSEFIRESADNIVYRINAREKKILRISKRLPIEDIEFEFNIFEHLSNNNFPVPKWNKTKEGKIFAQCGNTIAVMFDFLEGYCVKVDKDNLPNKVQAQTAGRSLALLHNISLDFKIDLPRKRNIFFELERAIGKKKIFISEFEGGQKFIEQVEEAIKFGKKDKNVTGLIHNDYRPDNVLFNNDNEISGVIDFDWSCMGSIIKDLALGITEWSFPDRKKEPDWELFDAFLDGYNSVAKNKYEKGASLYSWIKFTTLSDACTYFCDSMNESDFIKKIGRSYMYRKYLFFK